MICYTYENVAKKSTDQMNIVSKPWSHTPVYRRRTRMAFVRCNIMGGGVFVQLNGRVSMKFEFTKDCFQVISVDA